MHREIGITCELDDLIDRWVVKTDIYFEVAKNRQFLSLIHYVFRAFGFGIALCDNFLDELYFSVSFLHGLGGFSVKLVSNLEFLL